MSQRLTMACIDNVEQQGKVFAAQRLIYEKNSLVNSSAVEALLQDASWVLTLVCLTFYQVSVSMRPEKISSQNTFSERLSPLRFNLFSILLPNFMHEVELGSWKVNFIHLLQMLSSVSEEWLMELDRW